MGEWMNGFMEKLTDVRREKMEAGGAERSWTAHIVDEVIDPADTRRILALSISMSLNKKFGPRRKGVYRM